MGEVLTATHATAEPTDSDVTSIGYQWYVDREAVTGATSATYTIELSDVGKGIHVEVEVTYTDSRVTSDASAVTLEVQPGLPEIMGDARLGKTVTADTSKVAESEDVTFEYQWLADRVAIPMATERATG